MNIILLISDTFRYDNLFDRAALPVHTPNLDAFASRAVSFSHFFTGSFPTIPQRTDLISGRFGWPWYGWQDLQKSSQNAMPQMLAKAGYVSQLICDCPHLFNSGFQKTFDAAQAVRGQEGDLFMLRMNHEILETMPWNKTRSGHHFRDHTLVDLARWTNRNWKDELDRFPPRTAELAVEWLEENYQFSPFLLWVDFFDPHEPWDPPEYMVRKYDSNYRGVPMLHPNYGKATDYTDDELHNLRAHYCAEAELVDRWVGRVLQKIDDLQLWDNTLVIFTTDHGISLGEHNRTGKTNINDTDDRHWPIYPEVAHIPFMVSAPGLEGNRQVNAIAQPADILPTLADLVGIKLTPPEALHGRSFKEQLLGSKAPLREFAISSQHLPANPGNLPTGTTTPVLYTHQWAYVPIGVSGNPELYDVTNDPLAQLDLSQEFPGVMKELKGQFLSWLAEMNAPRSIADLLKNN